MDTIIGFTIGSWSFSSAVVFLISFFDNVRYVGGRTDYGLVGWDVVIAVIGGGLIAALIISIAQMFDKHLTNINNNIKRGK